MPWSDPGFLDVILPMMLSGLIVGWMIAFVVMSPEPDCRSRDLWHLVPMPERPDEKPDVNRDVARAVERITGTEPIEGEDLPGCEEAKQ